MKRLDSLLPPERVSLFEEDTLCYSFDATGIEERPMAVARPISTDEVSTIMSYAYERDIPIVPRGAGTGMSGGSVPLNNSIVLSFERMNNLIDIDASNLIAVVEPGVINGHFQRDLEALELFYPPDPASMDFCTLGGNVAENAGGPRALKYGVTRDYVLGLEIVMPDGKIALIGTKTQKGVVGYDLTRLVVGSEGTLAAITKIFLRLLPMPRAVITLLAVFDSVDASARAVSKIIASSIIPRTLEFMDRESIKAVEAFKPTGLPTTAEAVLLIEVDGSPKAIKEDTDRIASICIAHKADIQVADEPSARQRLWEARRAISPALYRISPTKINEDIVVPRSKIPEMLAYLRRLSEDLNIRIVNFGHAGDGNIHVNIMTDRENAEEFKRAGDARRKIFEAALKFGGTISGEHGVGITKAPFIPMEMHPASLGMMKAIKRLFDPKGLMNPGKIFEG